MNKINESACFLFGELPSDKTPDFQLDARGLQCPLPLLKMKLQLKQMNIGSVLSVLTTDETSVKDFKRFCELSENQLLMIQQLEDYFEFYIEKGLRV